MTPQQRDVAVRLADSLEWLLRNCSDPDSYPMSMCKNAAVLLRELVAEPAHYTITWDNQGRRLINGELAPEHKTEPQEEPVAVVAETTTSAQRGEPVQDPDGWLHDDTGEFEHSHQSWMDADGNWTPVYTHPPQQRKPLTDEQIKAIWWQCESKTRDHDPRHEWWSQFARAIERAHGIGETP